MEIWTPIADVIVLLAVALLLGILMERLKQNALIGYLLSGVLLGPAGVGLVESVEQMHGLAELGVALLLFTIGTEFSLERLRGLGAVATVGGTLQILVTGVLVAPFCYWIGLPVAESIAVGAAVSVSSTAVVLRVLLARAELDSLHGRNALGILLLQDLAVVPLILTISFLGRGAEDSTSLAQMALSSALGVLLIAAVYLAGKRMYPYLLGFASAQSNRELPVILGVTVCLGTTYVSHAVGLSPILGAFVGGMLIAESPFSEQVRADIGSLRAVFVTLFFASAGMLAEIPAGGNLLTLAGLVALIMVVKAFVVGAVMRLFRQSYRVALASGLSLAQIGEFSFVLLAVGVQERVVSDGTFQMLQTASVITLVLTPYLIAAASRVVEVLAGNRAARVGKGAAVSLEGSDLAVGGPVIVVGYGPAGQNVVRQLREARLPFLVLDMNPQTVEAYRSVIPIEFGDATQSEILYHAGLEHARALIVTIPDTHVVHLIIRQARLAASRITIVARARHHIHAPLLRQAGADFIIDEEDLVGGGLGSALFQTMLKDSSLPAASEDDAL